MIPHPVEGCALTSLFCCPEILFRLSRTDHTNTAGERSKVRKTTSSAEVNEKLETSKTILLPDQEVEIGVSQFWACASLPLARKCHLGNRFGSIPAGMQNTHRKRETLM